jgi:hypothetical protein
MLFLAAQGAAGQQANVRVYLPNMAEEDWSFLKDPASKSDFWDPVKYIALGRENWFLTLGGEIRYRPEGFRIRGSGENPSLHDAYLLQRYLFGANLHMGRRFRLYGEFQSGIVNGKLATPRPTDQNLGDIHQGFLEWKEKIGARHEIALRVGRQELAIGSSRLISSSPGLNVKRSFDGAALSYRNSSWRITSAVAKLVSNKNSWFDDRPDHEQTFWGVAAARKSPRFKKGELGFYDLGIDRLSSVYVQGIGREQRHTVGVKWSGSGERFDLNYDGIVQWGRFSGAATTAWGFSTETGYRIPSVRLKPRFSARADFASGDKDAKDPKLQSFNPLFPGASYSGAIGLLGPTNLTDFTPAVTVVPHRTLVLGFECPNYWRTSTADGVYGIQLQVLVRPEVGGGHYVGSNPGIIVVWQATRHLQIQGAITRFLSGAFLKNSFVANGFGFYSATALYRF